MIDAEKFVKLIQEANHYEDGWLLGFKDGSGLRLYTDEDGVDHVYIQTADGEETER